MATAICNGTGNFTGAATFAIAEAGALATVLNRNTMESLAAAATVTSTTFTVTTGDTIDAVLLWLRVAAASPTGTLKVDLQKSAVSQATCTVNKADLPQFITGQAIGNMVPVLFKLGATAAGTSTSVWTIVLTTTGTVAVNYAAATASTTNMTRTLRTTTARTLAAADDVYVIGELTGAGTHTARTVTMDSTAATAYGNGTVNSTTVAGGGIHCGFYGTLTYGTTGSVNYVLRVNGDLWIWEQGPFSIGASGSEIPRNSTAVLEFQQASADGDFGLRCMDNSVVNVAGLSRTIAKNVVQCKLTADVASSSVITSAAAINGTNTPNNSLEASGLSLLAAGFVDAASAATHSMSFSGPSVTNTTQTATVWLARGSGTNNRFVRVTVGNNTTQSSVTNGFFSDIDLQAGTAGTVTAVGNGTATSVSITAVLGGFLIRMTGKCSSGAAVPSVLINSAAVSGTMSYTGAGNQAFIYDRVALVTAASISDTTFNVDTNTGWLNGDAICVASTTQTSTQCEIFPLNADAGSSSLVSAIYPFSSLAVSTHNGTAPVQAEVGLLTRNVKIRSTSSALTSYVYCTATATVTCSWAEIYYVGSNNNNKRGVEIDGGATANAKSITFCSIHDTHYGGFYCNVSGASLNVTFSNNVMWNIGLATSGAPIIINGALTNTDWTLDSNLIMRSTLAVAAVLLSDVGGTVTNTAVIGGGGGFSLQESSFSSVALGTFSNNSAHSHNGVGLTDTGQNLTGLIDGYSGWRNLSYGVDLSDVGLSNLVFHNLTLFGNSGVANFHITSGLFVNMTGTNIIAADTTFPVTNGILLAASTMCEFDVSGLDMSGSTSIYAPHSSFDFDFAVNQTYPRGRVNNSKFGAPSLFSAKTSWVSSSYIGFEKFNQTAGDHRTEMTYGQLKTDTVIYNTASPSMRMTPNSASNKLQSAPIAKGIQVAVNNGDTVMPTVTVRESVVGDGAAYNGAAPRLIVRANAAIGIAADAVLATYTGSAGSWQTVSGTTAAATDDGVMEFIVDCDGTAGWVNADDWSFA